VVGTAASGRRDANLRERPIERRQRRDRQSLVGGRINGGSGLRPAGRPFFRGRLDEAGIWHVTLGATTLRAWPRRPARTAVTAITAFFTTDIQSSIFGINSVVFARLPFYVLPAAAGYDRLTLKVSYDDGFVAYLNGRKSRAACTSTLAWNSTGHRQPRED